MLKKLSSKLRNYKNWTYVRFLLRFCPGGGNIDFLLSEKSDKTPKDKSHIVMTSQYEKAISLLNSSPLINDELRIPLSPRTNESLLYNEGRLNIESEIKCKSSQITRNLKKNGQPNDPIAVLLSPPNWEDGDSLTLSFKTTFYSDVKALRQSGQHLYVVSATGVLFSEDEQCLLVHRRGSQSDYYPNTLHTLGGAYMPPGIGDRGDYNGLKECLVREVHEESGISLLIPDNTPKLLIDEHKIGFIQTSFLGINVPGTQLNETRPTWEGKVVKVPFQELLDRMMEVESWTLSGWIQIVLWLALGTPNSNSKLMFGKQTAEQLCQFLIKHITKG